MVVTRYTCGALNASTFSTRCAVSKDGMTATTKSASIRTGACLAMFVTKMANLPTLRALFQTRAVLPLADAARDLASLPYGPFSVPLAI